MSIVYTTQKFINAYTSSISTKVSSLYPILLIIILIYLQRINTLQATIQVMLKDSKDKDNKEEEDNNNIDNCPSYKLQAYKPYNNNSNNKGTILSSRLLAKQQASITTYNLLIELLKS